MLRTIVTSSALGALLAAPVLAAGVAFPAPDGWSPVAVPPSTDAARTFAQWHIAGDIATVTFIRDASVAYADALTTIQKNFSENNIKPTTNKDNRVSGQDGARGRVRDWSRQQKSHDQSHAGSRRKGLGDHYVRAFRRLGFRQRSKEVGDGVLRRSAVKTAPARERVAESL